MKSTFCHFACFAIIAFLGTNVAHAQMRSARAVVPGTGTWIDYVGDDFEDTSWDFNHRHPKSSREQDQRLRSPTGRSTNGRWLEGPERGQPDSMQVIPTPPGGLPGSHHALLVKTLNSGIPGRRSYTVQQDDLIANCISRLGTTIPVREMPNVVTRIYLPPADQWENRSGPQFGFRISTSTTTTERTGGFFARTETKAEPYWPGMWIHFRSETSPRVKEDSAYIAVRGNSRGQDVKMLSIPADKFGWWTLGMSVTGDGMVHYYASPGVDDLTAADHITSQYPYSFNAERFRTFFFDSCNRDDGRTWSTPFVIDDARLYVVNASRVQGIVQRKIERKARSAKKSKSNQTAKKRNAKNRG